VRPTFHVGENNSDVGVTPLPPLPSWFFPSPRVLELEKIRGVEDRKPEGAGFGLTSPIPEAPGGELIVVFSLPLPLSATFLFFTFPWHEGKKRSGITPPPFPPLPPSVAQRNDAEKPTPFPFSSLEHLFFSPPPSSRELPIRRQVSKPSVRYLSPPQTFRVEKGVKM